jgi:hypothetical protein
MNFLIHFVGDDENVIHDEIMLEAPPDVGTYVKYYGTMMEVNSVMLVLQRGQQPFYRVSLSEVEI